MNRYVFVPKYTPKKTSSQSLPLYTPLSSLRGIGPLFTERLEKYRFRTIGDLVRYIKRPNMTQKNMTDLLQKICTNPRALQCLGPETKKKNRFGRKVGNRYQVRKINTLAYESLCNVLKKYLTKKKMQHTLKKIPKPINPQTRPILEAYPKKCA